MTDGEGSDVADEDEEESVGVAHLADVEDGCGCAEVWEHVAEQRDAAE